MNVRVTFLYSQPLLQDDLDSFKHAAQELTNSKRSIQVSVQKIKDDYAVVTNFTMRTTAQYKVVDDISRVFKFWTGMIEGYQDSVIQFPKN